MQTSGKSSLGREQVRGILARHHGAKKDLARELGVSHAAVSSVLNGRANSARVMEAAEQRARELLAQEEANAA